jgi:hypothetical protein
MLVGCGGCSSNALLRENGGGLPNTSLAVTTNGLYTSSIGSPYEARLSAKGGAPRYTWSIAASQIPPGLTLDTASGKIVGTPTPEG